MAVKFLDKTGLGYFWGKIKAWCNSTFAAIAHTHTSYAVKHSYTTAANAAKNWYRIANANTQQLDTSKPIRAQFIVTAYNTSYAADYYETWFVNAVVFGRTAHIVIFGNSGAPFSQARILYENTVADIDANDRPAIDLYLNAVLPNGTTKIEVEEIYNNGGWTFLANGQLAASSVPSGFESLVTAPRNNGVNNSNNADFSTYLNRLISNFTAAFTLADSYLYRSRTLNCTGTFTITVPSINSGYMWCVIKNKNTTSGVITLHPSTTSVLIDGSNADITLQPMEYVCIHSAGANNYSLIADGRWKSQKADKATTLAGYGITDAKIANGTITLGSNSITPLTSHQTLPTLSRTISGSGNAITDITVSNHAITATKGTTFLTSHQDISGKVDKSGDTMTGNLTVPTVIVSESFVKQHPSVTKGTNPSATQFWTLTFGDKNGSNYSNNCLGMLETSITSEGVVSTYIRAMKNTAANSSNCCISCIYDTANNTAYTAAPTPATADNSTKIATTAFVKAQGYLTSHQSLANYVTLNSAQTITGTKTVTTDFIMYDDDPSITFKYKTPARGTAPSTGYYTTVADVKDKNGNRFAGLYHEYLTSKYNRISLLVYRGDTTGSGDWSSLGIAYDAANAKYVTNCPNPASDSNTNEIATTKWVNDSCVKTSGDQDISGYKVFTTSLTVKRVNPYLYFIETDATKGGATSTDFQGIYFCDKNLDPTAVNGNYIFAHIARVGATANENMVVIAAKTNTANTNTGYTISFGHSGGKTNSDWYLLPSGNGVVKLGSNAHRWGQIYSSVSTISTSDARVKNSIANVSNAVLDAWDQIEWKQFKFNSSVEEKGFDAARFHTGVIAQNIESVFNDSGLDAHKYGLFCYDEWEAEADVINSQGSLLREGGPAGNLYSIRYEEALCMEAAYQRRKNKILENRISELEKQVSDMLQILQNLTNGNG